MIKFLRAIILCSLLGISTVRAGSMKFSPSTGDFGMYCTYSGYVTIDTASHTISAIDSKIFATHLIVDGFTPSLLVGSYARLGSGGTTLKAVYYPWKTYITGSSYLYINRYANTLAQNLNSGNAQLYSFLFASNGPYLTGFLDFYSLSGRNEDDSTMQSGIVNGMRDVLVDINSGSYSFLPRPCIVDVDPPLFAGYESGASYNPATDSGFYFTLYDYTGNHIVGYNTTEHYRFQAGIPDTGNLANYVPVPVGSGIDNQEGVNSGSITVYLSGISAFSSGTLLPPTMFTLGGLNCTFPYAGPGNPLTRDRSIRGYTCFVPFAGLSFGADQTVLVVITGADTPNFYNDVHTGSIRFTFNVSRSAPPPPVCGDMICNGSETCSTCSQDCGSCGGGGGGGCVGITCYMDDCPDGDYSPTYYDDTCTGEVETGGIHGAATGCLVENSPYDVELTNAFQEAYAFGITNKCPIETAKLKDSLLRKNLDKMLVYFSVKVLGVMPDSTKIGCENYADMKNYSDEMKFYTKLGCQLEIMGMEPDGVTPMKNFYPEQTVTRAQLGATLSRLIFGRRFNAYLPHRYTKHLEALKRFKIIKIITPDLIETKGFVMLMFQRIRVSGLVEQFRLSAAAKNGVTALNGSSNFYDTF